MKYVRPSYGFERPWYRRRRFYIPMAGALLLLAVIAVYASTVASDLTAQAAKFDLSQLEQMESASVILDRSGKIFGQIYVENRETIPYDQIPRDLVNAVVAVEDSKFYQHSGYDLFGILRAALKNFAAGHVRQGASTITQQLARNSFSLKERTFGRKLLEIFLARRIEQNFGKQKIMELYLNRIYFGAGLYGCEAASRGYFAKPAREMTLAECATLAGLIKSPNRLSPWGDKAGSRDARNSALTRMRDLGFIDRQKCASAQTEDMTISSRQNAQGQTYAVDYIRQQVIAAVGWDRAMNEGFRIHTTIDADLQKVAEDSLRQNLEKAEQHPGYDHQTYADYAANFKKAKSSNTMASQPAPEYLQGAVFALDNQTGGVVVLVGGRDFEHNQYDRATQARRPAGTAMKPFVYAAAFENGDYPGTAVDDSAMDNRAVMIGGTTGILGEWGPESEENRYEGTMTARQALARSKNGATVRIGMDAGLDNVLKLCKAAGIRSPLRPYPATFLGSSEVTLTELALAYTIFPNGGWRPGALHILERIEEKDGTIVWDGKRERTRQRVVGPETAYEVHSCLVDALDSGTGKAAHAQFGLQKIPGAAGKTGTAYDFTDALFAGYDSALTCAVWAGFDKPQKIYRGAFGREIALPVWVDIMNASIEGHPPREIARPATLQEAEICSRSGLLATDKCYDTIKGSNGQPVQRRTTYKEIGTAAQLPTQVCNVHGELRGRIVREAGSGNGESEFPRAAAAVDVSDVQAVHVKTPALIADRDPYNSAKGVDKIAPPPAPEPPNPQDAPDKPTPETGAPIMKAIPVHPEDKGEEQPLEIRKAEPVGPLDEVKDQTLLNAATPPPTNNPDDE
jgi:penicillin-binding protein 1A